MVIFRPCHCDRVGIHLNRWLDTSEAVKLMLVDSDSININKKRISTVLCNVAFLCEVKSEEDRLDLRRDNLGVWLPGHRRVKEPFLDDMKTSQDLANSYVWRITSTCKAEPTLKRTEIHRKNKCSDGSVGQLISPVFVQYKFAGPPKSILVLPHGNAKSNLPFHPTDRTLLTEIRNRTRQRDSNPLRVYNQVNILWNCHLFS